MSKFDEILNSSTPADAQLGEQIDKLDGTLRERFTTAFVLNSKAKQFNFTIENLDTSSAGRNAFEMVFGTQSDSYSPIVIYGTIRYADNGSLTDTASYLSAGYLGSSGKIAVYSKSVDNKLHISVIFSGVTDLWSCGAVRFDHVIGKRVSIYENTLDLSTDASAHKCKVYHSEATLLS